MITSEGDYYIITSEVKNYMKTSEDDYYMITPRGDECFENIRN